MKKSLLLLFMLMTVSIVCASVLTVQEYTEMPYIDVYDDFETQTVTVIAAGDGHIRLYWDDMLQAEGESEAVWVIPYGDVDMEYLISATAQQDGMGVSEFIYYSVYVPAKIEPEDPLMTGWWIVLIDLNGEQHWYQLYESANGDWVTTLSLGEGYGVINNQGRTKVPYYFVVDGVYYGAPEEYQSTFFGEALMNPLYEGQYYYTVPAGYCYVLGISINYAYYDYYVYCAQGPQIYIPTIQRGDVNDDGTVDIADVTALIDILLTGNVGSNAGADCNQDGSVNIADVTKLIDYLLSGSW